MEQYTWVEVMRINSILTQLQQALEKTSKENKVFDEPVTYFLKVHTFNNKDEFSLKMCGIDFSSSSQSVINTDLAYEKYITENLLLLYAEFFIKGLDQPVLMFSMYEKYCTLDFEDIVRGYEREEFTTENNAVVANNWRGKLSVFISVITNIVNNNLDLKD